MEMIIRLTGTRPLLMHNEQLADPFNEYTREMKAISGKRKKTDEDLMRLSRLEFLGGLYTHDGTVVLPTWNIKQSFRDGGKAIKQGTAIGRAFNPLDQFAPLEYDGPDTVDGLADDERFYDRRMVKVGTSKVLRTRPVFTEWACEFTADLDTAIMNPETFAEVAERAGLSSGVGDFRDRFGRYSVEVV